MEEALTAYLQQHVSGEGANMYRHLCDLVGKAVDAKDQAALDKFEEMSVNLKYARGAPPAGVDKRKPLGVDPFMEAATNSIYTL